VSSRPEGQRLRDAPRARRCQACDADAPVPRRAAQLHQPQRDERAQVSRERRGVEREHPGEPPHRGPGLAAHGDGIEQCELRRLDADRAQRLVVEARDDPGDAAGAEAEAVGRHRRGSRTVGLHERCIYIEMRAGQGAGRVRPGPPGIVHVSCSSSAPPPTPPRAGTAGWPFERFRAIRSAGARPRGVIRAGSPE